MLRKSDNEFSLKLPITDYLAAKTKNYSQNLREVLGELHLSVEKRDFD